MRTEDGTVREAIDGLLGTVDTIMETNVVVLRPDQPLQEAIRALERGEVSGGPVMEGDRLVGMASLADLFRAAGVDPKLAATSGPWHRYEHTVGASKRVVADAMTRGIVSLTPDATIAQAAEAMRANEVNRIPIVDAGGALRGIVARDDIVAAVAAASQALHSGRRRVAATKTATPAR
jgi:CBS domain-containing protein